MTLASVLAADDEYISRSIYRAIRSTSKFTRCPNTYSPIYTGESGNLDDRGFSKHHKRDCWLKHVNNNEKRLAVYLHLMPGSTADERRKIESKIIEIKDPSCNSE